MDQEMRCLLALSGHGARGEAADSVLSVDYKKVLGEATEQEVYPLCLWALQKDKEQWERLPELHPAAESLKRMAFGQALGREKLFGFLEELREAGFSYMVIKGCAVAECYEEPFLRISSDTDLFIEEKQEAALLGWLRARGFQVEERKPYEYHSVAKHDEYGCFELHVLLTDSRMVKFWTEKSGLSVFAAPTKPPILVDGRQGSFYAMDPSEQMLFVTMHFIKHYLGLEGNLRMVLDNCVYASRYRDKIDWDFYWDALKRLGYAKLMRTVFAAAEEYMGFSLGMWDAEAGNADAETGNMGVGVDADLGNMGADAGDAAEEAGDADAGAGDAEKAGNAGAETGDIDGFLEILFSLGTNGQIVDEFKDLYRSTEMNLGDNSFAHRFAHRITVLRETMPFAAHYLELYGLKYTVKRVFEVLRNVLFGRGDSGKNAELISHYREIFHKNGLWSE